jgi:hypothetical protein
VKAPADFATAKTSKGMTVNFPLVKQPVLYSEKDVSEP